MPSQPRSASGKDESDDPNNRTETEGKDQKPHGNDRISVIKAAFHGLYSDGWTQNSIVTIVAILVTPLLTYMWLQSPKGMLYGFGIGATIALWGLIAAVAKHIDTPKQKTENTTMSEPTPPTTTTVNISSTNQSGNAITAHTVFQGDPPWGLLAARRDEMTAILKASPKIEVGLWITANDGPADTLSRQIMTLLASAEIKWKPFIVHLAPLVRGVRISPTNRPVSREQSKAIREALKLGGIDSEEIPMAGESDTIVLVVGVKP